MKEMIEREIARLRQLKLEQQERLQNAEQHVRGAQGSLLKIEGALEVCQGMLDMVDKPPAGDDAPDSDLAAALAERSGGNGEAGPPDQPAKD